MGGDARLREFYQRHGRGVLGRARVLLGDSEAAKDAMQEVFLRIITKKEAMLDDPSPASWLYRVTTNFCLNQLRDERRRQELLVHHQRSPLSPEDLETRAIVLDILARVPPEMQEIALYFHLDEMTQDEIATLVGLSRRTVGNRLLEFRDTMAAVAERELAG